MLTLECTSVVGPSPYSLHIMDQAQPWRYPVHSHREFGDLLLVERGQLNQRINGEQMILHAGELVLVRPRDQHELWGNNFRFLNLNLPSGEWDRLAVFAGDALPMADLMKRKRTPRTALSVGNQREILDDLAGLIAHQGEDGARLLLARFCMRWLPHLAKPTGKGASGSGPSWLSPLLRHIETGIGRGLSVADLPRHAGVGQEHLARSFRRHVGTTPSQYLNRVRLRLAALRLARTGESIIDIGYALGFHSPSYFYRLFARTYGVPPAAYRRRHRLP